MKKHNYLFAASLSLLLAACALTPGQFPGPQPVLQAGQFDQVETYRSLVIKDDGFETKGTITSAKRAVVVTIGTSSYTLTYKFMNKLRYLLGDSPYNTGYLQGIALSGFFTRLKATATTNVAANTNTSEQAFGPSAGTASQYLYTLSASEAAFADKLGSYNGVEMPNYLQEDETYTESTGSYSAVNGNDSIHLLVNKTGVRNNFFAAINRSLSNDFGSSSDDHVLDKTDLDSTTGAAVWVDGTPPTGSLFKYDNNGDSTADITTAEKTFLSSLVAKNPYAENV
ncbi:MAG: hypothetical protein ACAI44_29465, partial [Candidatus Sericytochromatia bacterium]